jgi:7-carboxy-7-deazaguanine synthase
LSNSRPTLETAGRWRNRHEQIRERPDVVRKFIAEFDYQLKFVLDEPDDIREVSDYLRRLPEVRADRVLLMPQGTSAEELDQRAQWLVPLCDEHGFVFCPRQHIYWYGHTRGT